MSVDMRPHAALCACSRLALTVFLGSGAGTSWQHARLLPACMPLLPGATLRISRSLVEGGTQAEGLSRRPRHSQSLVSGGARVCPAAGSLGWGSAGAARQRCCAGTSCGWATPKWWWTPGSGWPTAQTPRASATPERCPFCRRHPLAQESNQGHTHLNKSLFVNLLKPMPEEVLHSYALGGVAACLLLHARGLSAGFHGACYLLWHCKAEGRMCLQAE